MSLEFRSNTCYLLIVLKMNVIIEKAMPVAFAIVLLTCVHGTEVVAAAQPEPGSHECGCSTECVCRVADRGCGCSGQGLTMKARCGCGGSESHQEGTAPSWETVFAQASPAGAPQLEWSPAPDMGDPLAWRLPFEHEHPPKPLP